MFGICRGGFHLRAGRREERRAGILSWFRHFATLKKLAMGLIVTFCDGQNDRGSVVLVVNLYW